MPLVEACCRDRMLAIAVVAGRHAFAALTEFTLSILTFLTIAALMVSLSHAPELRCALAPLVCLRTTPG